MDYDQTDIARRYDTARQMPEEAMRLWLDSIARYVVPGDELTLVDVGCGTGRFSDVLADRFDAHVIAIDPSETMLAQARAGHAHPRVTLLRGHAEHLPLSDNSVDIAYVSMAYHHFDDPSVAISELARVLGPHGLLFIRNSTLDFLSEVLYLKYFPEAVAFNRSRMPSRAGIIKTATTGGFTLMAHEVIEQQFSSSFKEYCARISHRALSDLAVLTDSEFQAGMERMNRAVREGDIVGPITEPIDLFVFEKRAAETALPIG